MTTTSTATCFAWCIADPAVPHTLHYGDLILFDDIDGNPVGMSRFHDSVSGRSGVDIAGRELSATTAASIAYRLTKLAGQAQDVEADR